LRDVITVHISQEEREWLDALKHSYLDLVEFLSVEEQNQRLILRSIGDARVYCMPDRAFRKELHPGQVLLTRVIREPGDVEWDRAVIAAAAIVVSNQDGKGLLNATLATIRDFRGIIRTRRVEEICQAVWICAAGGIRPHATCRAR
jgi:hypothetical protein